MGDRSRSRSREPKDVASAAKAGNSDWAILLSISSRCGISTYYRYYVLPIVGNSYNRM